MNLKHQLDAFLFPFSFFFWPGAGWPKKQCLVCLCRTHRSVLLYFTPINTSFFCARRLKLTCIFRMPHISWNIFSYTANKLSDEIMLNRFRRFNTFSNYIFTGKKNDIQGLKYSWNFERQKSVVERKIDFYVGKIALNIKIHLNRSKSFQLGYNAWAYQLMKFKAERLHRRICHSQKKFYI